MTGVSGITSGSLCEIAGCLQYLKNRTLTKANAVHLFENISYIAGMITSGSLLYHHSPEYFGKAAEAGSSAGALSTITISIAGLAVGFGTSKY